MITVVRVGGVATVQDGGRPGRMHLGVPPGGPLCPELMALANLVAGNAPDAPAIELSGRIALLADVETWVASDRGRVAIGPEPVEIAAARRVGYIAFRGGLDVPSRLGGRGTLLVAGDRPLRAGDHLRVAPPTGTRGAPHTPAWVDGGPIRVILGPDPGDVATLLGSTYEISHLGDRVGQRLTGPAVRAPALGASAPLVRGAIQTTPAGELVVMGPDHPTTGGYPVVAVIAVTDQGRIAACNPATKVRFSVR